MFRMTLRDFVYGIIVTYIYMNFPRRTWWCMKKSFKRFWKRCNMVRYMCVYIYYIRVYIKRDENGVHCIKVISDASNQPKRRVPRDFACVTRQERKICPRRFRFPVFSLSLFSLRQPFAVQR